MKILIYGAGVIGSYLAHVLCSSGHDVSMLARGKRREELDANGLVIHHYRQKKTTIDHPRIVERTDLNSYSAYFDTCGILHLFQNLGIPEITPAMCS